MNNIEKVQNIDCVEFMKQFPDKYFDIAIVDPPYGINVAGGKFARTGNQAKCGDYTIKDWDTKAPDETYFNELFRVSTFQIIWGANHFISRIPYNATCWVVWDKDNTENDFADCELAWTNFKLAVKKFKFRWAGMLQQNMRYKEVRIHPTQKPVALYSWLLKKFGKFTSENKRILDTHIGSGSSRIACYDAGFEFYGTELDKEYFDLMNKRFQKHLDSKSDLTSKENLFEL